MWHKTSFWGDSLFVLPANDTVEAAHGVPQWVKLLPVILGAMGIALGYLAYMFKTGIPAWTVNAFRPLHTLFFRKWFFDELYDRVFVKTAGILGNAFWKGGDQAVIDDLGPNGLARASQNMSGWLSRFQTGFIFQYAFVMMIGLIGLVTWIAFRTGLIG